MSEKPFMHDSIKSLFYCLNLQQMVLFWTDAFVVAGTLTIMIIAQKKMWKECLLPYWTCHGLIDILDFTNGF